MPKPKRIPRYAVHFWGSMRGERVIAPCTEKPPESWIVTGDVRNVTCPVCKELVTKGYIN